MVPLGEALISAIETRRQDFAEFARATNLPPVTGRILDKDTALPVTFVSRKDADAFCRWLTQTERNQGLLEPSQTYSLPSDDAWSMAASLPRERGDSPSARNLRISNIYPWGFDWPPQPQTGNFLGRRLQPKSAPKADRNTESAVPTATNAKDQSTGASAEGIEGFDDGYDGLAPVMSFRTDSRGIADLAGNVWEWVGESWGSADQKMSGYGVARGGAYTTGNRNELLASCRLPLPPDSRRPDVGFRVILLDNDKPPRSGY